MINQNRSFSIPIRFIAFIFAVVAIYIAANTTYRLGSMYMIGPMGDAIGECNNTVYPIVAGTGDWSYFFKPLCDHRIVIARLMMLSDVYFFHGQETWHWLRVIFTLWLTAFLFGWTVFTKSNLSNPIKYLLVTLSTIYLFLDVNFFNFMSTVHYTWPGVLLFSLMSIIAAERFTFYMQGKSCLKYLFFTAMILCALLTEFTFSVGILIWPILLVILFKRHVIFVNLILMSIIAILAIKAYFLGWHPATASSGIKHFLYQPHEAILYAARILSLPSPKAIMNNTFINAWPGFIGLFIGAFLLIRLFLSKKEWDAFETIIWGYMSYCFLAIGISAIMRFAIPAEKIIGLRFASPAFIYWLCLISLLFYSIEKSDNKLLINYRPAFYSVLSLILLLLFSLFILPWNFKLAEERRFESYKYGANGSQYYIALALHLGSPKISSLTTGNGDINSINNLSNFNEAYHLTGFSLWETQFVGKKISNVFFKNNTLIPGKILTNKLYTQQKNPAVSLATYMMRSSITHTSHLFYTDNNGKIIGFALLRPSRLTLRQYLTISQEYQLRKWLGFAPYKSHEHVYAWLVDEKTMVARKVEYGKID